MVHSNRRELTFGGFRGFRGFISYHFNLKCTRSLPYNSRVVIQIKPKKPTKPTKTPHHAATWRKPIISAAEIPRRTKAGWHPDDRIFQFSGLVRYLILWLSIQGKRGEQAEMIRRLAQKTPSRTGSSVTASDRWLSTSRSWMRCTTISRRPALAKGQPTRQCRGRSKNCTTRTREMPARNGISIEDKQRWMRERQSADPTPSPACSIFTERHYTCAEVAALWNISPDEVRKIFQNEPGVLVLGNQTSGHKRRYTTLRIPESVLERVHRRLSKL